MNTRAIESLTAAGIAAVLTAATITATATHPAEVNHSLRTEFAAVQLQALVSSAVPAAAATPEAVISPSAVAAAAAIDPVQVVTDIIRNAVGIAAAALWYAAFPITLPLSVIGGLVMSVAQNFNGANASAAADPLQGVTFFFTAPHVLLTAGFANFGLATNVVQQQLLHFPIGVAAATRPAAATKRVGSAAAAPAASARSAKKVAAAKAAPAAGKRAAASRR